LSWGPLEAAAGGSNTVAVCSPTEGLLPDPFGALPDKSTGPLVLTVGVVDRANLERKGHRAFVEAARRLPDVAFVLAGRVLDDSGEELRAKTAVA